MLFITSTQLLHAQTQEEMQAYDDFVQAKKDNAGNKYTYSQFAVALRYRDEIDLNELQTYALYREVANLKNMKNAHYQEHSKGLDTRGHESRLMAQILTDEQYTKALEYKNRSKVNSMVSQDVEKLTLRGILEGEDIEQVKSDLYAYYIIRESLYDRYRHDLIRQSDETKVHYYNRPEVLKQLNNKNSYSQFTEALKHKNETSLSSLQVEALYKEIDELQNIKLNHYKQYGEDLDTRDIESSIMTQILTEEQYTTTLELKNKRKVKSIIDKDIKEMTLRGVLEGEDIEQVKLDLYTYYIMRESLYDRYRHDLIRQSDETRQHYYDRPAILKKLTKARRAPQNNTLGQGFNGNN